MVSFGARPLALVALSFGLLAACTSTTSSETNPVIAQFRPADFTPATDTLAVGQSIEFFGTITDNQGLKSWSLAVLNSSGTVIDTARVPAISGTSVSFDATADSTKNLRITNDGSWGANGQYLVRLTVTNTAGDVTKTDLKIYAKGPRSTGNDTLLVSHGTAQLGAQSASLGSFLDVTRDSVWTSGPKPYSHIDIVFGVDGDGVASLMSPAQANGDGFSLPPPITLPDGTVSVPGWTTRNSTTIVYSDSPLLTLTDVRAVVGTSVNQKAPAQAGWYALKLTSGTFAALQVTSLSATDNTATVQLELFE